LSWAIFEIREKPLHSRQKTAVSLRFGSALKPPVFGFGLKTVTALIFGLFDVE